MKRETDPARPVCPAPAAAAPRRDGARALALICATLVILGAVLWNHRRRPASPDPVVREFAVFDSYARITLWAAADSADPALAECAQYLADLHRILNRFDPTSELARLNEAAAAAPFPCSAPLWDVLQAARHAYSQSGGAFDISVGPLMALWGFHRKRDTLPSDADIEAALQRVGLQRVAFDDAAHTVHFTVPGMSLDCGGLAKGYAVDRVMEILARRHVAPALVDLGGNVGSTAVPPPGRDYFIIGIRNPFATQDLLGRLKIRGQAVATSGNYERRIVVQGRELGHIIEPRTGRPVSGPAGVTAVAACGVDSDVFSTAVYVAGRELAETLARRVPGTGFVLVSGTPAAPALTRVGDLTLLDDQITPTPPVTPPPKP